MVACIPVRHSGEPMKGLYIPLTEDCRRHIAHWERHQAEWEALLDVHLTVKAEIARHQQLRVRYSP